MEDIVNSPFSEQDEELMHIEIQQTQVIKNIRQNQESYQQVVIQNHPQPEATLERWAWDMEGGVAQSFGNVENEVTLMQGNVMHSFDVVHKEFENVHDWVDSTLHQVSSEMQTIHKEMEHADQEFQSVKDRIKAIN